MTHVIGGCSTYSKTQFLDLPYYPKTLAWGEDVFVYNNDLTWSPPLPDLPLRWIDFTASLGAIFLGYGAVDRTIINHLKMSGSLLPLPHYIEEETAALFCSLTGWDCLRWCKNGSDATEAAVRLARWKTGRQGIITNSYHGSHSDLVAATPGKDGGLLDPVRFFVWPARNSKDIIKQVFEEGAAAVLAEPFTADGQEWNWYEIADACRKTGTLLIFDEIITGFRTRLGSAVDVRPDLACYGKVIGNGMPIACLAGPHSLMQAFEEAVFFSGTYAAELLSLAACHATLTALRSNPPYERLLSYHERLVNTLTFCTGYPGRLCIDLPKDQHRAFINILAREGILVGWDFFLMAAHQEHHIEKTEAAINIAREELGI